MPETKLLAVTGNPIFHSRSPQLFNSLFHEMRIDAIYTRLAAANSKEAAKTTKAMKLWGLNITSPFKEEMMHYLDSIDKQALKINAVNCVATQKNKLTGYNTDPIGAVKALEKNGVSPKNKQVVILGAGGAARAAAYGLIKSRTKKVIIMNRTAERAKKVSRRLGCDHAPLEKAEEILKQSDIFISCISTDQHIVNPALFKKDLVVMDANYKDSSLIQTAREKGCRVISGLEWLLYQALPIFRLFTNQNVPINLQKKLRDDIFTRKDVDKPNIALIGFMGSGKTAVGRKLAEKIGFGFVDTDSLIEKSLGMTIPEIFKKRGEAVFREREKEVIKKQIPASKGRVFSLGGGAILAQENGKILNQYCHVIWLWISTQTALKRINIHSRPLLNNNNSEQSVGKILKDRIPLYAKVSDLVISTETGYAEKIAGRIKDEMGQTLKD